MVEEVDPLERCEFDGIAAAPGSESMDDLGLVEAVDGFGECVVVRVADAADGRLDTGFDETVGVADGEVLAAAVAVMDEAALGGSALVQRLFKRVQHEVGACRSGDAPANDAPGETRR